MLVLPHFLPSLLENTGHEQSPDLGMGFDTALNRLSEPWLGTTEAESLSRKEPMVPADGDRIRRPDSRYGGGPWRRDRDWPDGPCGPGPPGLSGPPGRPCPPKLREAGWSPPRDPRNRRRSSGLMLSHRSRSSCRRSGARLWNQRCRSRIACCRSGGNCRNRSNRSRSCARRSGGSCCHRLKFSRASSRCSGGMASQRWAPLRSRSWRSGGNWSQVSAKGVSTRCSSLVNCSNVTPGPST